MRAVSRKKKSRRRDEEPTPAVEVASTSSANTRITAVLWYLAGLIGFWSCGYTVMRGSDLWWHLATGRWIYEHRAIPFVDPWSFTAKQTHWVVDAWLSDFVFYLWSRVFGTMAIVWWKWIVVVGMFLLLMRILDRKWSSLPAAWGATMLGAATAAPFLDIRPQLYSMLFFVVLLFLALDREKPSVWIVPLFLAWTNLHAGFTLGVITLPILLLPHVLKRESRRRTIILGVAALAVCLINPNGYRAFTQPILYALDSNSPFHSIGEWLPPFEPGGIQSSLYPWMIAAFVVAAMWRLVTRERPIAWVSLALGFLTLAMSLQSRRFVPIFSTTMTLVLAPLIRDLTTTLLGKIPRVAMAASAVVLSLVLLWPYPQKAYAFHFLTAEYTFPIETLNLIEKNGIRGNVFAYFNWGGYIHLRTDGDLKVFIDGRASALFDETTYLDYIKVLGRRPGWTGVVDYSGADYFFWRRQEPHARELVQTGKWKVVAQDPVSILLARADRAVPPLEPSDESAYSHLTAGIFALESRDFGRARRELEKTLEIIPWEGRACDWLARVDVFEGKIEEGRRQIEECQEIFPLPERVDSYEKVVLTYLKNGSIQEPD